MSTKDYKEFKDIDEDYEHTFYHPEVTKKNRLGVIIAIVAFVLIFALILFILIWSIVLTYTAPKTINVPLKSDSFSSSLSSS